MRIRKIAESVGVLGKILNSKSNSKQDTYSANYIENNVGGGIIETITNENGTAIKFANGIMICHGIRTHLKSTHIEMTIGGYRTQAFNFSFPLPFISLYTITATSLSDVKDNGLVINGNNNDLSSYYGFFYTIKQVTTEEEHKLSYIAIGRWK